MYSNLLHLEDEQCYREEFCTHYCKTPVVTHQNISVKFHPNDFDHAFFGRSSRRNKKKDIFDLNRAKRLHWIKLVLMDSNIPIYKGNNSTKSNRRVSLLTPDGYIVVIRLINKTEARFVTAFVIDDESVVSKVQTNELLYNPF